MDNRAPLMIAGPCAVESEDQIDEIARRLSSYGTTHLRGGAFKPRTSPASFQGLGWLGLEMIRRAAYRWSMDVVSEVVAVRDLERASNYIDILQIGSRSMFNVDLLLEAPKFFDKILIKRHFGATIKEMRGALEYMRKSRPSVEIICCERGIRTHSDAGRFTLDLSGALELQASGETVIIDPSHAAGVAWQVVPLARASIAAGLDGLIVEVHDRPDLAKCDARQAISSSQWSDLLAFSKHVSSYRIKQQCPHP